MNTDVLDFHLQTEVHPRLSVVKGFQVASPARVERATTRFEVCYSIH